MLTNWLHLFHLVLVTFESQVFLQEGAGGGCLLLLFLRIPEDLIHSVCHYNSPQVVTSFYKNIFVKL